MYQPDLDLLSSRSSLDRLESLGDNCELGFVLRRLGHEAGGLFRWASIGPEHLEATLRGDFAGLYEFENLVPCRRSMVRDLRYGTAWHSKMTSTVRGAELVFDDDEPTRRAVHAEESAKRDHLLARLREKFAAPGPVFVIKHNAGIPEPLLESIHYQLYRRAAAPDFTLLEVRADPARAGQVETVDRNRLRGFVSRFAPYERAEEGDDRSWRLVLAGALAHRRDPQHAGAPAPARAGLLLPFPVTRHARWDQPIPGDLRAGLPILRFGNEWCRLVDDDLFRLHASAAGERATTIIWPCLLVPAGATLSLRAACAIPESQPVRTTLRASGPSSATECSLVFSSAAPAEMSLALPGAPLRLSLTVEPLQPLRPGERAVIDIVPIAISSP